MYGGNGNDYLAGGQGSDTLRGGTGSDIFIFQSLEDFNQLESEKIDLSNLSESTEFTDLTITQDTTNNRTIITNSDESFKLILDNLINLNQDDFIFSQILDAASKI